MKLAFVLALVTLTFGCRTGSEPVWVNDGPTAPGLALGEHGYGFRLDVPDADPPEGGWPLLLFLHGAGERGNDLAQVAVHGPLKHLGEFPELDQLVLLSPQCPTGEWWDAERLMKLVRETQATASIDEDRIYVTGLSMGGYGTWNLLSLEPTFFAAAIPICGGGDFSARSSTTASKFDLDRLLLAKDVPIRIFHGEKDQVVLPKESLDLHQALAAVDADVEITLYLGTGHDSWSITYRDRELYSWLLDQHR